MESSKEQDSDTEIAMIEDVTEGKADSSECGRDGDKGDKEKDKDKGKGKDKPSDEEKKDEWGTLGNVSCFSVGALGSMPTDEISRSTNRTT